jgi:hypothetical protein
MGRGENFRRMPREEIPSNHLGSRHTAPPVAKSKIPGGITVRFEMPFVATCETCGHRVPMGSRHNASKVATGRYLSTTIYTFHFTCPDCRSMLAVRTDPQVGDFAMVSGARRATFQSQTTARQVADKSWDGGNTIAFDEGGDLTAVRYTDARAARDDPMRMLENAALDGMRARLEDAVEPAAIGGRGHFFAPPTTATTTSSSSFSRATAVPVPAAPVPAAPVPAAPIPAPPRLQHQPPYQPPRSTQPARPDDDDGVQAGPMPPTRASAVAIHPERAAMLGDRFAPASMAAPAPAAAAPAQSQPQYRRQEPVITQPAAPAAPARSAVYEPMPRCARLFISFFFFFFFFFYQTRWFFFFRILYIKILCTPTSTAINFAADSAVTAAAASAARGPPRTFRLRTTGDGGLVPVSKMMGMPAAAAPTGPSRMAQLLTRNDAHAPVEIMDTHRALRLMHKRGVEADRARQRAHEKACDNAAGVPLVDLGTRGRDAVALLAKVRREDAKQTAIAARRATITGSIFARACVGFVVFYFFLYIFLFLFFLTIPSQFFLYMSTRQPFDCTRQQVIIIVISVVIFVVAAIFAQDAQTRGDGAGQGARRCPAPTRAAAEWLVLGRRQSRGQAPPPPDRRRRIVEQRTQVAIGGA